MARKKIRVALAGNPNCGKTTVFNNLTHQRGDVGNYPGVTVEIKTGSVVFGDYEIEVTDLPGTYSLSAYSQDELVARNMIVHDQPDVIVNIIDAATLERNLYLTLQLLELEVPMIVALNMVDVAEQKGFVIDDQALAACLGSPVVRTVGHQDEGTGGLLFCIVDLYEGRRQNQKIHVDYGPEIFDELQHLERVLLSQPCPRCRCPVRWLALKILEQDPWVLEEVSTLKTAEAILQQKEKSRQHLKAHFGEAPEMVIADRRYGFVSAALKKVRSAAADRYDISDTVDKVVLNRVLGFPIFALVMFAIFKFTFGGSQPFVAALGSCFEWLARQADVLLPAGLVRSFVVDGLIHGLGGLLEFVPLIIFMFLAIAFFEDSGYMARAAFLMDKFMARFGLHGKSFLPLMISTNGCAVLGLMSSRTLENPKDRLITMLVTPFMICGAKLPIFALFIAAFFPAEYAAGLMFLMYVLSIAVALGSAWVLRTFVLKGEGEHFVMELPPYRLPSLRGILLKTAERVWVYLRKAGTVILGISVLIWAGFTFPRTAPVPGQPATVQLEQSFAGRFARFIEPGLRPIGLDWRSGVALVGGVAAKEVVVSTLGTFYSLQDAGDEDISLQRHLAEDPFWNPLKAFVFLIFSLFYSPCLVAVTVFFKESGSRRGWTIFLILGTTLLAWLVSFLVYQTGMILGMGA